jgi:DNA repair exonuclease SbcCD nuclease subunit
MSERSIQLLKSFLDLHSNPNEDILLIGGDLFDNINKVTYFDMLLYGKIISLFKKVYLINGNHDIMNQIVNVTNLLTTYKRTITIKEVSTIQISPELYVHFIPYYPREFLENTDDTLTDIVIRNVKSVISTNTYSNNSLHLFISHAEITEIITQFENIDTSNKPHFLNYSELRMFLQQNNLNYKFLQGHYHTKDIRVPDNNYYVITCFPKSFSEKTVYDRNSEYGYYEFDIDTHQLIFNEWTHQVKYVEFMSTEYDKYEQLLNDSNHLYVVKLHLTDNPSVDDVVINKLSNNLYVRKVVTLSNLLGVKVKDTLQQETEVVEEKYLTFEEYFIEYLKQYVQILKSKGITYDENLLIDLFNTYVINPLINQQQG